MGANEAQPISHRPDGGQGEADGKDFSVEVGLNLADIVSWCNVKITTQTYQCL